MLLDHVENDVGYCSSRFVKMDLEGHGLQAEDLVVSCDREAVTALDQGEESALYPG
jgi:hypothetical protein